VHISGLWTVIKNVADGRPTILMDRFDPATWARCVRDHRLPVGGLTPSALRMVLDAGIPPSDLASLRGITVGTAPTPPDLVERFVAAFGVPVLTMYGATEFAGAVAGWTRPLFEQWWAAKRGSVGRAYPGCRALGDACASGKSAADCKRHSGAHRRCEPGISRFRVWSFGPSRNDDAATGSPQLRPERTPRIRNPCSSQRLL